MNGLLLSQSASASPNLAPVIHRLLQGGLGGPPGSTATLFLILFVWLAVLAIISCSIQGDWRSWLRGFADIRAHFDQLGAGLEILRRNKRPLWVALVAAVLSWSSWSLGMWRERSGREELEAMLAVHSNSAISFAGSHAFAGSLVPMRDLVTLGDFLPLIIGACVLLFARTPEVAQHLRGKTRAMENVRLKRRLGTIWVGLIILVAYRVVGFVVESSSRLMASGCMYVDTLVLPFLLLVADGLLLSWVLVEFGRGAKGHFDWHADDTAAFVRGIPAAAIVCGLSNPGRYVMTAYAMWEVQVNQTTNWPASRWSSVLWANSVAQVLGLMWFAMPGVLAVWRRGGVLDKFRAYLRLIRQAGGQVLGLTALAVLLNILVMIPVYWLFASMQPETWSLIGAASYGHYATLLLGMVLLAGSTQLAYQELGLVEEPSPVPILVTTAPVAYEASPASG